MQIRSLVLLVGVLAFGPVLACSSSSDKPQPTPSSAERVVYCNNVQQATTDLQKVKDALQPFNPVAMVEARQNASASIELLYTPAQELEGGGDALDTLKQDLAELNRLFATQDLGANAGAIQAQVGVIATDLKEMKDLGSCP